MLEPLRTLTSAPVEPLPDGRAPRHDPIAGRWVMLEPLDPARHAADLFNAGADEAIWRWLWYGPFNDRAAFTTWLEACAGSRDPLFFAICEHASRQAQGMAALLNIRPSDGVAELGHIWFALSLQRTAAATEALALLIRHVMGNLGYRRLEWKCDAANQPSRQAALRLGFRFEGIFHRHMVVKGRNRDTAWFSLLAEEWPAARRAFDRWLARDNFDTEDRQYRSLAAIRDDDPARGILTSGPSPT